MSWLALATAVTETFKDLFGWKTGGRTNEENADRDEMRKWHAEEEKAIQTGDFEHAGFARRQLLRLHQRAQAKADR